jgi:two-component system nitrogen regulation sensor histidine kinase NtrY
LILLDDVTELMRSNQLAAWAEMARAIAHEIKNPLTPIQLSTEHLRRVLHDRGVLPSEEIESCLSTVMKQVYSLRQIAGEFSTYAKLPVLETETVDPVSLMRSAVGPYKTASPQHVQIVEHYDDDAGPVAVDSRVICRALINLIENALQAMPDGGRLTVAVASLPDGRDEVALEVRDTGVGLTPEVKRRLFEPYFSTKSSGTGLGLAISRRAVEAHQGRIEVESELQTGTTMRVVLPQASV